MIKRIIINGLLMLLITGCFCHKREKAFIEKYEFEDFHLFKGANIAYRGTRDSGKNDVYFGFAPILRMDTSIFMTNFCTIINNETYQIVKVIVSNPDSNYVADTIKIQQLVREFRKYKVQKLEVDSSGNVFVYLKDFETLGLVRFADKNKLRKYTNQQWAHIKGNWYRPEE